MLPHTFALFAGNEERSWFGREMYSIAVVDRKKRVQIAISHSMSGLKVADAMLWMEFIPFNYRVHDAHTPLHGNTAN